MEAEKPPLKKATPEEFERLLRGETVTLSLENDEELHCRDHDRNKHEIILIQDFQVGGWVELTSEYKYPIHISGRSEMLNLIIHSECDIKYLDIHGEAKINRISYRIESKRPIFKIYGKAEIISLDFVDRAELLSLEISGSSQISKLYVGGVVSINQLYVSSKSTIQNIEVTGDSSVDLVQLNDEIEVHKFKTDGKTAINEISLKDYANLKAFSSANELIQSFKVQDNARLGDLSFSGERVNEVVFSGKSETGDLRVYGEAKVHSMTVTGSAQTGLINLFGQAKMGEIKVSAESKTGNFIISNEATAGDFFVLDESEIGNFSISGTAKMGNFIIGGKASARSFNVLAKSQTGYVKIAENSRLDYLLISDESVTDGITIIDQGQVGTLRIGGRAVTADLQFLGGKVKDSFLIENSKLEQFLFTGSGTDFPDEILIQNVTPKALRFVDFRAGTSVKITNVKPWKTNTDTYLEFTRSSFQKLELIGNFFQDFDFLVFENSDLRTMFIADTDFPNAIKKSSVFVINRDKRDPSIILRENRLQAKLFFEQVKTVLQNQGNRTEALKYQSKELNEHYKLVKLRQRNETLDKLTLWFNKWSNGFGTNWLWGVGFFLVVTILLYSLLLLSTPMVTLIWPWQMKAAELGEFATHYFDFINPTSHIWKRWDYIYQLENIPKDKSGNYCEYLSWSTKFLLLFSKILIITMAYQIVQAFRKFGRR